MMKRLRRSPYLILVLLTAVSTAGGTQDAPPDELYRQGVAFLEDDDWESAISRFEAVLQAEPEHIPSLFNLAVARAASGEGRRAMDTYRRLLGLDDSVFEARMNLALLLDKEGRAVEALEQAAAGVRLRPGDALAALYRAELLDRLGRIEEAAGAYRDVIDLDPARPVPHERLGALYRRAGRDDQAYESLLEAARLGSGEVSVHVFLGDIAVEREALEEARDHYRRALERAGEDRDVRLRMGLVLSDLGDYAGAIAYLEELEGTRPVLAEAYLLSGRPDAAREAYQSLVREEPDEPDHWYGLARSYYDMQMIRDALEPLARVVRLDPGRESAWGMMGAIYHQLEDFESAVTALDRRIDLLPDDAQSHFMLAVAFDNLQNFESALLHYNKFLELDDGSNDARTFQVQQRAESLQKVLDQD